MSIKLKLPLMISTIVTVLLLTSGLFVYFSSSDIIVDMGRTQLHIYSEQIGQSIYSMIKAEQIQTTLIAEDDEFIDLLEKKKKMSDAKFFSSSNKLLTETNDVLSNHAKNMGNRQHIFVIDTNGIIISDSNPENLKLDLKERPYFQKALRGEFAVSDIITSKVGNEKVVAFASPIKNDKDEIVGVLGNAVYLNHFATEISKVKVGKNGYAYLMDSTGIMLFHPDEKLLGTPTSVTEVMDVIKNKGEITELISSDIQYTYKGLNKLMTYTLIPHSNWMLSVTNDIRDIESPVTAMFQKIVIFFIFAIIVAIALGITISKIITNPIIKMSLLMKELSTGNLNIKMDITSKDEIGTLSNGFNSMVEKVKGLISNLSYNINILNQNTIDLNNSAKATVIATEETAKTAIEIAHAIESQTNDTQSVSYVVEQFGENISDINKSSDNVRITSSSIKEAFETSNIIMNKLMEKTEETSQEVEKVYNITNKLNECALSISEITTVIKGIASQTNLLSLNASIEAARAGEHGKGFSVVANEIRKLADMSTKAVSEIDILITNVQSHSAENARSMEIIKSVVTEQTHYVDGTCKSFSVVNEKINDINSQIEKVAESIYEINIGKDEVISSIQNISASSEEISASIEEVSATAEEQSAMAQQLQSMVDIINNLSNDIMKASSIFKIDENDTMNNVNLNNLESINYEGNHN